MKKIHYLIRMNIIHKLIVALIFFILCLTAVAVVAVNSDKKIELKKAAIIKIMKQGKFKAYIQDDPKLCSAFLNDFVVQKNIEHIKPIVEADNYDDPKLQSYLKKCPNKEFHKSVWAENPAQMRSCEEGDDSCGMVYYATRNFKLYRVNVDNNIKNGEEYVLYAEGYKHIDINKYTYGGYNIIDLKKCEIRGIVHTRDPFDYVKQQPIENYNGIIEYRGEYYVFELREDTGRRLILQKYNKNRGNMNSICEYRLQK